MSSKNGREEHTREILNRIEAEQSVSQRSLSRNLGIALGLTNLLLRQMARKGYVKLRRDKPNRVRYLITPAGLAERARLSQQYFRDNVALYVDARRRIAASFATLAETIRVDGSARVVFWGAGELAEICYVSLQETGLSLVGVVDDTRVGRQFFGLSVLGTHRLGPSRIDGVPYDALVVLSLDEPAAVRVMAQRAGIDLSHVFWL